MNVKINIHLKQSLKIKCVCNIIIYLAERLICVISYIIIFQLLSFNLMFIINIK